MFKIKLQCIVRTLFLISVVYQVESYGSDKETEEVEDNKDPELTGGFFEGDMLIDDVNLNRNVLNDDKFVWPDKTVYYQIEEKFNTNQRNHILRAMRAIELVSCIKFEQALPTQKEFVNIVKHADSCFSEVGYQQRPQRMSLADHSIAQGCFRLGSIIHELLHVLGFVHQQNVADRDRFVRVIKANIQPNNLRCFDTWKKNATTNMGKRYDYSSILHYGPKAYSKNNQATIVAKYPGADLMGQRTGLSILDIRKLNIAYNCRDF